MLAELTDGSSIAIEATAIPVLLAITIGLGRFLKRHSGIQLGPLYQLFCITFAVWLPLEILGTNFPFRLGTMHALRAANVLLGTIFILAIMRRYYWELWFEKHQHAKAPKFLSQLFGLILFIVAVFVVIGGVYGQSIEGVIFGSTVVVGIVGFAMQDLLGNIIAGIALEIGKPFKTGDWLKIENQHAEVIEVNWRSTRLRTNDDIYLDIPNKSIVGATITNLTYPTRQHAIRVTVGFDYATPPNFIKDVMSRAAGAARGVLATPPPKVYLKDFGDSAVIYEIKFWLEDESSFNDIVDGIRTNVWYAAQRHGIRIPFPIRTVQLERAKSQSQDTMTVARASVRKQPFLQLLDEAQLEKLLAHAKFLRFGRREKVIVQGAAGESMFILLSGEAHVYVQVNGADTLVATLRTGDYCGEMSLLTGAPRSATVVAGTDCEMWEIGKEVLAEILQENETLVEKLSELLAQRRMETEGIVASSAESAQLATKQKEYTEGFLKKLYSFFEL
ncbi:MAG: mechanosensitive ion channel family protein [Chthoniobacter sp.]|uniref:mechanosensitive ion channel family protein n=1 Tax=Chthoniobacter sp. TaxID=2510640 RepID=UPI0032AAD3F5